MVVSNLQPLLNYFYLGQSFLSVRYKKGFSERERERGINQRSLEGYKSGWYEDRDAVVGVEGPILVDLVLSIDKKIQCVQILLTSSSLDNSEILLFVLLVLFSGLKYFDLDV